MTIELNSKVLHIIYNRKWIKDITGDSFSGNITIFLHDGFTFADTGLTTAVFSTVRKAALGASRNTVINHNAKPKRVAKPKKKVELKEAENGKTYLPKGKYVVDIDGNSGKENIEFEIE